MSLFAQQGVPPLLYASGRLTVHSLSGDYHRQCFDRDDFQWSESPCATPVLLPPAESVHVLLPAASQVETVTGGWHYNRPPPVS